MYIHGYKHSHTQAHRISFFLIFSYSHTRTHTHTYEEHRKTKYRKCAEFIIDGKSTLKRFGFIKPSSGLYER